MIKSYKHFYSKTEADLWINEYKTCFPSMEHSDKELLKALDYYTASANVPINNHLRFGNPIKKNDFCYTILNSLLSYIPKYKIPDSITAYRFIPISVWKYLCSGNPHKNMTIIDPGFMSTTLLFHGVDNYKENRKCKIILEISIPIGTPGTYVGLTNTLSEYEILLAPNTQLQIDSTCIPFQRKFKCTVAV